MARGPKFSFPIPGRKSRPKVDKARDLDDLASNPSTTSLPQWSSRVEDPSSYSKAQRLLGTGGPPYCPSSRTPNQHQTSLPPSLPPSLPQSPGYMTVTVSEASFGSDYSDKRSSVAMDEANFYHLKRPGLSNRPSSNILGNVHPEDGRRGSNGSSFSRRLLPQTSDSTMRSYYDPQKSPLAVSQQTSDSAVRDRALRKGYPQVTPPREEHQTLRPSSRQKSDDMKKQNRKSKPTRLDLSKLFPKPRANGSEHSVVPLLSPNKLVNSPSAMSTTSDYFPRPMTREPTPTPRTPGKLTKRQQAPSQQPQKRATSPVRLHKPDAYDSAKVNVRRPPRGIQHWFEGLDEESDDEYDTEPTPVIAPTPFKHGPHRPPVRKSSLGRLVQDTVAPQRQVSQSQLPARKDNHAHVKPHPMYRLHSPSQFSVQSQSSAKTKESAFSKSNLQDSSVLSMSSSEDEGEVDGDARALHDTRTAMHKAGHRDSMDSFDDHGEIMIGKAHAFEVRPRPGRRVSESKLSMRTTSTNAATIEVMYTPEPYTPQMFPRHQSSSRRSSHVRQPSMIPEDEHVRPKTSANPPMSPTVSVRSSRTSASEPRSRAESRRLMAVTEEEEALLEMMRQKRAAMAKHSFTEGYKTAILQESRQNTPPESENYRTSAFLSNESPSVSPARVKPVTSSQTPSTESASPLLFPPPRGRPAKSSHDLNNGMGMSILRDSSSCEPDSARTALNSFEHQLAPHLPLSPLDPFPSSTPTASIASPTTTDHASPLPSPVTPGLHAGEADVHVKVASSEPSLTGDEEPAVLSTGVIDPPAGSIKHTREAHDTSGRPIHQRRRTASSDADVTLSTIRKPTSQTSLKSFPIPSTELHARPNELASVSETSSRTPSIIEPKIPRQTSKRISTLTLSTNGAPPSRNSSIYSVATSSSPGLAPFDKRSSRAVSRGSSISSMKRDSVAVGTASTRCSVSEDVLAAWGSLGGGRIGSDVRW